MITEQENFTVHMNFTTNKPRLKKQKMYEIMILIQEKEVKLILIVPL